VDAKEKKALWKKKKMYGRKKRERGKTSHHASAEKIAGGTEKRGPISHHGEKHANLKGGEKRKVHVGEKGHSHREKEKHAARKNGMSSKKGKKKKGQERTLEERAPEKGENARNRKKKGHSGQKKSYLQSVRWRRGERGENTRAMEGPFAVRNHRGAHQGEKKSVRHGFAKRERGEPGALLKENCPLSKKTRLSIT